MAVEVLGICQSTPYRCASDELDCRAAELAYVCAAVTARQKVRTTKLKIARFAKSVSLLNRPADFSILGTHRAYESRQIRRTWRFRLRRGVAALYRARTRADYHERHCGKSGGEDGLFRFRQRIA